MTKNQTKKQKVVEFLKKYIYVIIAIALLLILSISLAVSVRNRSKSDNISKEPVNSGALEFYLPLLNSTLTKNYSNSKLMYNQTLKHWEAHMAIDLATTGDNNVYSALDGVVESVYDSNMEGVCVVINHGNNLKTTYKSLAKASNIQAGDAISKGQVIGTAGTCRKEAYLGTHLHFEVEENGEKVDPTGYLVLADK